MSEVGATASKASEGCKIATVLMAITHDSRMVPKQHYLQ
jgi:hypothetical protein